MKPEQAAQLRAPFPPETIGKLPRAGTMLDYVGHAAATDRLLEVDPDWTWEPFALTEHGTPYIATRGNTVSMWIRLTVCGVTRPGVGTVQSNAFDVEKQLISDAIRNAAMRFGVALDLWSKEELPGIEAAAGPLREVGSTTSSDLSNASRVDDVPAAAPSGVMTVSDTRAVGKSTLDGFQARVSALIADKVAVSKHREARHLPPLKAPLSVTAAEGWKTLLDELEAGLEAPFVSTP